jgi:LysM repeat protein
MTETPRRNIRNEILIAVGALIMMGVAVGIALLLGGDSPAGEQAAVTQTVISNAPTESWTAAVTATATATPQPTEVTPSVTPTEAPTELPTESPTPKRSASATDTDVPASDTPAPTERAAATTKSTSTPPPSRTPLPSLTSEVTATRTPRPSRTPRPTNTRQPTATSTATDTATPSHTPTPTIVLLTPVTETTACIPPADWRPYVIQPGDNLFRIALRAGIPLSQMQSVNCIANAADIEAGQTIYAPPAFFASSANTGPTTGSGTGGGSVQSNIPAIWGCTLPNISIDYPSPGAIISLNAPFTVRGIATLTDEPAFSYYKLELRREGDEVFRNLGQSSTPVFGPNGSMLPVDPARFGAGNYQLILTVVDETGNYPEPCAIRVTFR